MKVVVIYRPNSDHGRLTEEFLRDFQRLHPGQSVETLNIDSRDGSAMATLYDIVQYPAIIVLENGGQIIKFWSGEPFPRMEEVAAYARL